MRAGESTFQKRLDEARTVGDWSSSGPNADELVEKVFRDQLRRPEHFGRVGYHHLLVLADQIMVSPELLLIQNSHLNQQLARMPQEIVDYFDPMPAPDWVDEKQLAIASRIWVNNTITLLLVLYASSLPSCYLIQKGIPVLYTSDKLRDRKNISQRLFETGFMLDDVMSPGGIKVIQDVRDGGRQDRYLWGRGYLSAKKVRVLHASMRLMLQFPPHTITAQNAGEDRGKWKNHWDVGRLGIPINQEDMAYTLLTFGYLLPRGLEIWGDKLTLEEKNAVLHLWKVTGYIMGIQPDLMTDKWDEAESLFGKLQARGKGDGSTEAGLALTETVMGFVGGYFPKIGGMEKRLPATMIIDQCGLEVARYLIAPELIADSRRIGPRFCYGVAKAAARIYFFLRNMIMPRMPMVGAFLANLLHGSGKELVESFRDSFVRQPFFIPKNATTWEEEKGATEEFHQRLDHWRQVLFRHILFSIVLLAISLFCFVPLLYFLPNYIFWSPDSTGVRFWTAFCSIGTLVPLLSAIAIMKYQLPAIFESRPSIKST